MSACVTFLVFWIPGSFILLNNSSDNKMPTHIWGMDLKGFKQRQKSTYGTLVKNPKMYQNDPGLHKSKHFSWHPFMSMSSIACSSCPARNETLIPFRISLFLIHVIHSRKYIFFSFQIKDYSCRLDSAFGIFSFVGCVMVPEIVVFQDWRVFQQLHHSLPLYRLKKKKKKKEVFLTSGNHFYMTPVRSTETQVPSFFNKTLSGWVW